MMKTLYAEQQVVLEPITPETVPRIENGPGLLITTPIPVSHTATPLPNAAKRRRSTAITKQQAMAVTSAAIAITYAATAKVVHPIAEYQGTFQIAIDADTLSTHSTGIPQIEDINQTIDPPLNYEAQIQVLQAPRVINPVVARLQSQGVSIDYASLTNNLHLTYDEANRTIQVSYRDSDSQNVQRVLAAMAQAYLQEGQNCQTSACQGFRYVEEQLPHLQQQVKYWQIELQAFQQRHSVTNLEAQRQWLSTYTTEVAKQEAEIQGRLSQLQSQHNRLQKVLGLSPESAIADKILNRDSSYHSLLHQMQVLENQIVQEYSRASIRGDRLQTLYQDYQTQLNQLRQQAQTTLAHSISSQYSEPDLRLVRLDDLKLLQQWMDMTCYLQVLEMRQETIAQISQQLNQRMNQWATLKREHDRIQRELQTATIQLNQYLSAQQTLKARSEMQEVAWNLVAPPQIVQH